MGARQAGLKILETADLLFNLNTTDTTILWKKQKHTVSGRYLGGKLMLINMMNIAKEYPDLFIVKQ